MSPSSNPVNLPLTLPLQGSQLIEASAGTGKTWTIAALVLRCILGHGCTPRQPGEILVMTFTKAATRELADRIRQRLVQAAAVFRAEAVEDVGDATDDFLRALRAEYPDAARRAQAAWRLAQAADAIDEAAIHTIDAWCQRMLREHAFDSHSPFEIELLNDAGALQLQAVQDYWRQQVYPLEGGAQEAVLGLWPTPEALRRAVQSAAQRASAGSPLGVDTRSLSEVWQAAHAAEQQALQGLKAGWVARALDMEAWIEAQQSGKLKRFNGQKLKAHYYRPWFAALVAWAQSPGERDIGPKLSAAGRQRLVPAGLLGALRDAADAQNPDFKLPDLFSDFERLVQTLDQLPRPAEALQAHATQHVRVLAQQLKARAGVLDFQDQLERLDAALDEARAGEAAKRLRARILAQFPVVLIDEFQDTSPLQLSVFDRLYRLADNDPSRALLLIGDPKQAIYSFRGADIHSYLRARSATAGRHHRLHTNHRSSVGMVNAVNALFLHAEARPGAGAFRFRTDGTDVASPLPFEPVAARGRDTVWMVQGRAQPALTLALDETPRSREDAQQQLAEHAAEQVVRYLNDPHTGFAAVAGSTAAAWQRLRPADIALLVRDRHEAAVLRRALARRGVPSVFLSDRDRVFESPEAEDLLRVLQAVSTPRDTRLLRQALGTRLLGFSLDELQALLASDEALDRCTEQFEALLQTWQGQGVLAVVRQTLHRFDIPARGLHAGERALTNVLHLGELLQVASEGRTGAQGGVVACLRWLREQVQAARTGQGGDAEADATVLRLESDADLVQVVTIHKSKGLEYPVVLLPFASAPSRADKNDLQALQEELRLLYVALTRARHALWLGATPARRLRDQTQSWQDAALGYLLAGETPREAQDCLDALLRLAQSQADLACLRISDPAGRTMSLSSSTPPPLQPALGYRASFSRQPSIGSYSGLVREAGSLHNQPAPEQPVVPLSASVSQRRRDDDQHPDQDSAPLLPSASTAPWHRFPRGAQPGNFLHDQLEWLAAEGFDLPAQPQLQTRLRQRCERDGRGMSPDDLLTWMLALCQCPLPPLGRDLRALSSAQPELEFWLRADDLDVQALDRLCRQHIYPERPRPTLSPRRVQGWLMGFADLVFEADGCFWVLDYKSNRLGPQDADYHPEALATAVLAKRYDVQAALYLLALHRHLRARLGRAYAPARHLGGALYWFLRGVGSEGAGCCLLPAPLALLDALDALLDGGGGGAPDRRLTGPAPASGEPA